MEEWRSIGTKGCSHSEYVMNALGLQIKYVHVYELIYCNQVYFGHTSFNLEFCKIPSCCTTRALNEILFNISSSNTFCSFLGVSEWYFNLQIQYTDLGSNNVIHL